MAFKNYIVEVEFEEQESGSTPYTFPLVQNISIPKEGIKATVIKGNRGNGCIIIDGGKQSQIITVKGKLWSEDGYADLISKINTLKTSITTANATLTLKHWDSEASGGGAWINDAQYTVKRIEEITFGDSMLTEIIDYTCVFIVISY